MLKNILHFILEKRRSNLGKDFIYTLISQVSIMFMALLVNKLLSNMLGVEGYGQYSIIKRSASVLSFVMLSGMGIALPRYLTTYAVHNNKKQLKSTVISSILIILSVSFIIILICVIFNDTFQILIIGTKNPSLYISAILYASSLTLSSLLYAYYRGIGAFKKFSIAQISVQLIVTICVIFFGKDLKFLLNAWSVSVFTYFIISATIEKIRNKFFKTISLNWSQDLFSQFKTLLRYGGPRLIGDFFLFSFSAFPLIFISQRLNIEASSYFAVGITLVTIVTPLFSFLGMVLLPYVSSSIAQNNFAHANRLIGQLLIAYMGLSFIAILVFWVGIKTIIPLFFSNEFIAAAAISRILILAVFFESIYLLLRNPLDAVSVTPYNTYNLVVSFIVLLVLFYFAKTMEHYAFAYLFASIIKAGLSFFTWKHCKNKLLNSDLST